MKGNFRLYTKKNDGLWLFLFRNNRGKCTHTNKSTAERRI